MSYFTNEIITDVGYAMLSKSVASGSKVMFTRVEIGDGTYSIQEIAAIKQATSLKNGRNSFDVTAISSKDESIRIRATISNKDVNEGYYINEIGVYASCNDEAEKLVAISICTDDATYIPKFQERLIEIPITDYIAFSGDGNFTINYESQACVPLSEFEEFKKDLVTFDSGDSEDEDANSWTDVEVLKSGEKVNGIFSKVSMMFKNIRYLYRLFGTADSKTSNSLANMQMAFLQLAMVVQTMTDADVIDSENVAVELFNTPDDVIISSGYFDDENKRLYA